MCYIRFQMFAYPSANPYEKYAHHPKGAAAPFSREDRAVGKHYQQQETDLAAIAKLLKKTNPASEESFVTLCLEQSKPYPPALVRAVYRGAVNPSKTDKKQP